MVDDCEFYVKADNANEIRLIIPFEANRYLYSTMNVAAMAYSFESSPMDQPQHFVFY